MAELNKLTDRILDEAKQSANEILSSAKQKADKIIGNAKLQSDNKYKSIVEKGELEAESLKERLRSNANLKARDNELKAKQEVILKVYESALEDMKNIDDVKYVEYVKMNASFSSESVLVVQKERLQLIKSNFPEQKLAEDRFVEAGFIEIIGGIEKNFTFSSQLDYIKDDLQGEIAKILFK